MARPSRIAVGGIAHETHIPVPTPTTLLDVGQCTLATGNVLLKNARGTDGTLRDRLIVRLATRSRQFPAIDGVIQGVMPVDGIDDAGGDSLREGRQLIGPWPRVPVVDRHTNLSGTIIETADLIVLHRTYSHMDTRACSVEAMDACLSMTDGTSHMGTAWPLLSFRFLLLGWIMGGSGAFAPLARGVYEIFASDRILAATLVPGFPYSDVRATCARVLVTTDSNPSLASPIADELALAWWQARSELQVTGLAFEQPGRLLTQPTIRKGPIVLPDITHNLGAGVPGDSIWLLHASFDNRQSRMALAALTGPEVVADGDAANDGISAVQSSEHNRAAHGEIASAMLDVETPRLGRSQFETLPWTHPMTSTADAELAHV